MCSSDYSRRIFDNLGFKVTKNEKYREAKDESGSGERLFPTVEHDNFGSGYCKNFKVDGYLPK